MSQRHSNEGTVLITGASGGIGCELSKVFAANGFDLVLVARGISKLESLAKDLESQHGVTATPIAIDLGEAGAPERLYGEVAERGITVDVLVNNAALMEFGAFREAELDRLRSMTRVNVGATMALTHLFLAPMLERRSGRILNVGSIGAFMPMPSMAVYAGTKAFLLSLSEALSEELMGTGVTVTAFCAGFTRTPMLDGIGGIEEWMDKLPKGTVMDPVRVAEEAYAACMERAVIRVPGTVNSLTTTLLGLQPRWLVRKLGGFIGRKVM